MPDWNRSMQQTYEFYKVDPASFGISEQLTQILSGDVTFDAESETISHSSITVTDELGECYIRPQLVTIQDGVTEKFPLGSYLAQTPSTSFDGKQTSISMDAYSPLIELKEKLPPIGYTAMKNANILRLAGRLTSENTRAPVVIGNLETTLTENFVAEPSENWLTFLTSLLSSINYGYALDELGRILFAPIQQISSMQPIWTYNDDNSSILYPDISVERDLYGIPNVVEVCYSSANGTMYSRVSNDDPESPVSTVARGREIVHRETDPKIPGAPSQAYLNSYARKLLRTVSSIEYKLTYSHGFCPVRLNDCVLLNYTRAGLENVKAKVIRQNIKLETGCKVEETAVYTRTLWGNEFT